MTLTSPSKWRMHSMWLIAEPNCQLIAHPTPLLVVASCQFCLMKSYPYSTVPWSAYAYLNQLPFLAANSHSFACVSTDLSVQGVIYDTSIYQFGGWLVSFVCFFRLHHILPLHSLEKLLQCLLQFGTALTSSPS